MGPPPRVHRRPRVRYDFSSIEVGTAARFNRAAGTILGRVYKYLATAEGKGKKFVVRPITPTTCRIWRVK